MSYRKSDLTRRPGRRAAGPRRLLAFAASVVLALGALVLPAQAAQAAPPSVQVFVGYADTLRADPANFPTPWGGAPGVILAGCHVNCSFDAGAARFVNNSSIAVTIDSVRIRLDTCVFDMWPHGTVLQPDQQLIVTQTATGAADGCNNAAGFFDTSDIGPGGQEWAGHCNQSGVIPRIELTVDGTTSTFDDTGQVLNTGGVDKATCSANPNESTQWTLIGGVACPGAVLALAPADQDAAVGDAATVTATLRNSCGTGLQGAPVHVAITAGPHAGTAGDVVTDADGQAHFSYTGTALGTDTLTATTTNPAGTITSNPATVAWHKAAAQLAVASGGTSDFDDSAAVTGTLTDSQGPLPGRSVTFGLAGTETCTAVTDATGHATCQLTPHESAGSYPLTATFAGDGTHDAATGAGTFVVVREETTLAYTGPAQTGNGEALTLSGVLKEDGSTAIAGRTVTLTLGAGSTAQTCNGTTDATGRASCTIASVAQPAATVTAPVSAVFAGDGFYLPATATATLQFRYLTGRAYGLAVGGLVTLAAIPDTHQVTTASAATVAPPCVAALTGVVAAHTLCASVVTTINPGTSTATASVQDTRIGLAGLPVVQLGITRATSHTDCTGSTGDATISSLTVGGLPVHVDAHPAPNTRLTVLGVTIVLNEQLPVAGADQGRTVNAVHVTVLGLLDVVVASATSDIHHC